MRVLAITPWFPTANKPVGSPFVANDVAMLEEDHDVLLLHLAAPEDLSAGWDDPAGTRVVRVPFHQSQPKTWLPAARAIRRYARGADIVHTMALPSLLPTALARVRKPWVHTEHYGMLVSQGKTARQRRAISVLTSLLRFPHEVVAVGSQLAEVLSRARHGTPVPVVENHVAIADGPFERETADELRRDAPLRMVAVGGMLPHKGPIPAVETLAALVKRGWDASLTWVGTGQLEKAVRDRAAELGVEDRLHTPGAIQPNQLGEALMQHNLFLLPTEHETFGVALAEALGHGLPVVTTGIGGHLEFLPPHGSRIAPERTGAALADAVEALISDPELMDRSDLVEYARHRFDNSVRKQQYAKVYEQAMLRRKR